MLRLLEDKIAIIPMEDPELLASGLWVPAEARQRIDQGIIKYRAPGTAELRIGDHVFFSGYDGTKISIEGEGILIIMRETDVKAVIEAGGEQLFPLSTIQGIIERCHADHKQRAPTDQLHSVEYFKEILTARFNDWFMSEGIEW